MTENPTPSEKYSFERYLNVRAANAPGFSPDGRRLSFLTDITGVAEIWSVDIDLYTSSPSWPTQLTFRGERIQGATYSPASDMLLVSADTGGNELTQLLTLTGDGSAFTALTVKPECIYNFGAWSPDGKRIAYSCNERDQRYFDIYERVLDSGEIRQIFRHDGSNYCEAYAPDGQSLLVVQYESNIINHLLLIDLNTGEVSRLTPEEKEAHALYLAPFWSSNRKSLYLLSNSGRQYMTLAELDLTTGAITYLRNDTWDCEALAVSTDGKHMALVFNEDGYSRLELFDVSCGWAERRALPVPALPAGVLSELIWSQDGSRLAFTLNCANDAPDIWVWDVDEQLLWRATSSSLGGIQRETFVTPTLIHYPTFDGRKIPAFLYLPQGEQQQDLPVIINVHGGPESQTRPIFNPIVQYFVAHGYAVLSPNVRGSTGYGYEYQSLDDIRLRMDSVSDLRFAALWLSQSGIADADRIVVMGGSYGGFMVLSAVTTYPELWAAGVDIVGIANFVTFLENTGPWRRKLRESEYGNLENDRAFLEQISPIHSVERITAPLFVIHGANDPRVPVGEAEQIVAALRARNIPVEYLRFEDEGHGLVKRINRLIAYPAIARFLDQHLNKYEQAPG